jgi:hypothetical protein
MTKASLSIAEITQQDNAAMKAIAVDSKAIAERATAVAEDSKMVALATSQDSAAMRIIAVVTIFFLPATFTAVSLILQLTQ